MTTDLPPATDGQQSSIRRRERIEAILAECQARWPAVFTKSVPLAIGISRCIKEQLSGPFPKPDISITLHYWTNRTSSPPAVARGVIEAAMALGMRRTQVLQRIVLPQAMRVIIPPTGNETISMLKTSSLAFITTFGELFRVQTEISSFNYKIVELLIVISFWYLLFTSVLTVGQYYIERYFARGSQRELPPTPYQYFRRRLFTLHAPPPFAGKLAARSSGLPPSIPAAAAAGCTQPEMDLARGDAVDRALVSRTTRARRKAPRRQQYRTAGVAPTFPRKRPTQLRETFPQLMPSV